MTSEETVKHYATLTPSISGDCRVKGLHTCSNEALKILEASQCLVVEIDVPDDTSICEVVKEAIRQGKAFMAKLNQTPAMRDRRRIMRKLCEIPKHRLN